MIDFICPKCGTRNPPNQEVCQYCQASLAYETTEKHPEGEFPSDSAESNNEPQTIEEESSSDEIQSADSLPDWLRLLADEEINKQAAETPDDFLGGEQEIELGLNSSEGKILDLYSDLRKEDLEIQDEQEEASEPIEAKEDELELEPAELPDWLEAMRPVEFVTPPLPLRDESVEEVERGGPLAGIWGVLPSESEAPGESGQKGTSMVLQVSDNHRINANLLKGLLEDQGETYPLSSKKEDSSQHYLRWIIALALFGAIIWAIINTSHEQNPRSLVAPPEVVSVYDLINSLPAYSRVLVAYEYDPGFSPEMDAAAAPVVDHLLLRGAYLTMVSTSPIGPLLAERFLISTQNVIFYSIFHDS